MLFCQLQLTIKGVVIFWWIIFDWCLEKDNNGKWLIVTVSDCFLRFSSSPLFPKLFLPKIYSILLFPSWLFEKKNVLVSTISDTCKKWVATCNIYPYLTVWYDIFNVLVVLNSSFSADSSMVRYKGLLPFYQYNTGSDPFIWRIKGGKSHDQLHVVGRIDKKISRQLTATNRIMMFL